ncbi:cleavage and polyadenylation specificity factor subunit 7-like isoform X2 [Oryctolagus cuniculus]|uniref:cleavage and polyadenylation specificity factor subunit 7-like isoform X2 n=1 Tax=Oryctolagus cuniculus TaxID=9986 RepID=UPI0038792B5D
METAGLKGQEVTMTQPQQREATEADEEAQIPPHNEGEPWDSQAGEEASSSEPKEQPETLASAEEEPIRMFPQLSAFPPLTALPPHAMFPPPTAPTSQATFPPPSACLLHAVLPPPTAPMPQSSFPPPNGVPPCCFSFQGGFPPILNSLDCL